MTARGFDARLDSHLWRGDRWRNGEGVVWSESRRRTRRRKQSRRGLTRGRGRRRRRDPSRRANATADHGSPARNRLVVGSSRLSGSWPRVTRLCRSEGNGASLPKRKRTRRRCWRRVVGMKIAKRTHATTAATAKERASQADREAVRGGVSCRLLGGGVSTPTSTKGVERPNDRSTSRHAAAHRPPSNFHKILFTPGCSDLSLPLFLPFSLPPYHRSSPAL
jgi:hypothetical protein